MKLLVLLTIRSLVVCVKKYEISLFPYREVQKYFQDYVRGCEKKEENLIGHHYLKTNKQQTNLKKNANQSHLWLEVLMLIPELTYFHT